MTKTDADELDAAILGLRAERTPQPPRHRPGVVPISDQVREVARATGEAYERLKAEMETAAAEGRLVEAVEPDRIDDSAWRDRGDLDPDEASFAGLVASIAAEGQLAPATLRPKPGEGPKRYEVVFGHRRVAACRRLKRPVQAVVLALDDRALVARMLIENARRRDLAPIEKARHYRRLLASGLFERQGLADILGVTPQQVSNVAALARLPDSLLDRLGDPRALSIGTGKRLLAAIERHGIERVQEAADGLGDAGDAAKGASRLLRHLTAAPENPPAEGTVVKDRLGRRYGRLGRSGTQLVLRFQPGLDERVIEALARRVPDLYAEIAAEMGETG
ncbi:MAG: ParB/RepB/Spo0J family partition protein [Geminicoccaceae bacterium]|nr:ParB/RepB/Spo0J family partition protein [Geminicoccaceae bacterium]